MLSAVRLLKFKGSRVSPRSHSWLVDFNQIHVRNVFLFCFGLSMARQIFGDNIICQIDGQRIGQSLLDTKCFINGTRTDLTDPNYATLPVLYHDYYQWIPVVFLLMAFSFYFPFHIWSSHVHNFMEELTTTVQNKESCDSILQVIKSSKGNNLYWKTWLLEGVYVVHLIAHVFFLNQFFHQVPSLSGWSRSAIPLLFPEMSACFHEYFTGGGQTSGKFYCLMPLNSVYRKIFHVVYFLFIILIPLHVMCFFYRMFFALILGKDRINMWWCIQICKQSTKKWEVYHELDKSWNSVWKGCSSKMKNVKDKCQEESLV